MIGHNLISKQKKNQIGPLWDRTLQFKHKLREIQFLYKLLWFKWILLTFTVSECPHGACCMPVGCNRDSPPHHSIKISPAGSCKVVISSCLEDECVKRNPLFKKTTKTDHSLTPVWNKQRPRWDEMTQRCFLLQCHYVFSLDPSPAAPPWCHVFFLSEPVVVGSSDVRCDPRTMLFAILLHHWTLWHRRHRTAAAASPTSSWFISLLCCRHLRLFLLLLTLMSNHTAASVRLITLGSQASFAPPNTLLLIPPSVIESRFHSICAPRCCRHIWFLWVFPFMPWLSVTIFSVIGLMFIVFSLNVGGPPFFRQLHRGLLHSDRGHKAPK